VNTLYRCVLILGLGLMACSGPMSGLDDLALRSAIISGIEDTEVELRDGVWEGEPYDEGAASRPRVGLIEEFALRGGFTSPESEQVAVLTWQSSGGSGTLLWLAILESAPGHPRSVATTLIGDRVQVIDFSVEDGELTLELIAAGPDDAACCPGQHERRSYRMSGSSLAGSNEILGRASPADLAGRVWVLERFGFADTVAVAVEVTIEFSDGDKISGNAGCNLYTGSVLDIDGKDFRPSATASTMRRCPEDLTGAESWYFHRLSRVERFGFLNGKLLLHYSIDGQGDAMVFVAREG
jgi:heat shock protein HslJ